ncbi:MAG: NADH-quinone oxidoreductase subunit 1 [Anaerolineales bacterium]|nr:NADH-quinone oxidoreductase subunit 1 [Anaerolineales bacterium]
MEEHIVLRDLDIPNIDDIDVYLENGGYETLKRVLADMSPADVTQVVSDSGLRGRGGAGFPTGRKWMFLPQGVYPRYLVVNAAEGEPGTFKDRQIMERNPHQLIEGVILTCYAIEARVAYIYMRGEYLEALSKLQMAIDTARELGFLGDNIHGTDFSCQIYLHREGGAYICGEETALLNSLEGFLGQPRVKPPFPAIQGLYQKPTIINNVETLTNVAPIVERGAEWFRGFGTDRSPGTKVYALSGHVRRPGNYELPMDITLRELIYDYGGGVPGDHQIKGVIPGGVSAPVLTQEHLDITLDFNALQEAGSMLGSGAVMVFDETTDMAWAAHRMMRFFSQESCGKCSPCREGTYMLVNIMTDVMRGTGRTSDIPLLDAIADQILGNTLCPLGDAAAGGPTQSTLNHFRADYEALIRDGKVTIRG